ncbi:peptidyl-prolyl cis-trans isomerase B-like [Branchiostoma floridae]|uniref:Peptidyl-prolyl cis-trans isomerase n=1 Tax=Branchiostoma floridae TaxID=7739 RepID=C3YPX7_BRAFL|nr:peptidyl-prolyl cis-trans isomerase B-like [Branchiostoma floridae]|eukprot:XP_002601603.1 hypothetical protein BRAFLDRAFT_124341 [Branchiostoma floridae]
MAKLFELTLAVVLGLCLVTHAVAASDDKGKKDDKDKKDKDNEEEEVPKLLVTKKAWFDVEVDDEPIGRFVVGLFGEMAPITVANFAALARGNYRMDPKFGYKNTYIHRVVQDHVIQGGDITVGDGTGGKSIYGADFADETFDLSHDDKGWVSMANAGPDSNNSQFFITLQPARFLDKRHVAFGKIIEGMDIVEKIGEVDVDDFGRPKKPVLIKDCGVQHTSPYELKPKSNTEGAKKSDKSDK